VATGSGGGRVKKYIGAAFKAQLATRNAGERFYLDPRGIDYPPVAGTATYSKITSASNAPGSYSLTSALTYMLSTSSSFTVDVILKPNHASGSASSILSFLGGDALTLAYSASGYYVLTDRSSHTATGGTFSTAWKRLTVVFTFGGTMYLYVNGTLANSASAAALALNQVMLQVNGTANSYIDHVRIFNGYAATATDVANNFQNVFNEEIYWGFNKNAVGRTRCNVTDYCYAYSYAQAKGYKPATASISLHNVAGEFSADQYATFAPASGSYNGTAAQKYLAREMRIDIEFWANNISGEFYEPLFYGSTKPGSCARGTQPKGISDITISASDGLSKINSRIVRKSRNWAGYNLAQADGASSLFHEIAQLATNKEVYNYCGNSSFENTTIGNSWLTTGTIARSATKPLLGTYCIDFSGSSKYFYQYVIFNNLTAGEKFTFSIYCYATSAITGQVVIYDYSGATNKGSTIANFTHSGKGWDKLTVSHSVVDSTSDRLRIQAYCNGAVSNIYFDMAMLKYGDDMPYVFANNNDGASGIVPIGSEQLSAYEYIGIDADDVSYTHPWATINKGENCGEILAQICDASIAMGMYVDSAGVLNMRSALTSTLGSSLGTIAGIAEISSGTQDLTANKLTVSGVHVDVRDGVECVWQMTASGLQNSADSGSQWTRVLANTEKLPSTTYDGVTELECIYSPDQSGKSMHESIKK
jgi:hypothetical protein